MTGTADPYERAMMEAEAFSGKLAEIRARTRPTNGRPWYPYGTMNNVWCLGQILSGDSRALFADLHGKSVADIGGCDGDLSFFTEHLGAAHVDLIDNPHTSHNLLDGARRLKEELGSQVNICIADVDTQFSLDHTYDLALFLGILYHLKNPFYALEKLSRHARHAVLSTRVTAYSAPPHSQDRVDFGQLPLAYLLGPDECNNDATNFWIFTDFGLRRLFDRTGWEILDFGILGGDLAMSDPSTLEGDRRAFCYLRSKRL
jgi:tRNA (mo5U34)-methyltransferase